MPWAFVVAACVAGFFFAAERLFGAKKQRVLRRGIYADVVYAPMHVGLRILFQSTVAVGFAALGERIVPANWTNLVAGRPLWLQALAVLLVLDFFFYVMHRLKHRWTWWWRLHETHHSSVDLDFFASVRFHPLEKILDRTIFLAPFLVLGPSLDAILIWASADVFFGMFGHANLRWRLGPLKYVLVGPEMHRWHHVRDPAVRECNFGNNFSFFDWIFGTAYVSREEPEGFGVDDRKYPVENIAKQFVYAFRPIRRKARKVAPVPDETPNAVGTR